MVVIPTRKSRPLLTQLGWHEFRLIIFFIGIALSTGGWLLDRATAFPWLLKTIAPDYVAVADAFEILDTGENAFLPIEHPAAPILVARWVPTLPPEYAQSMTGFGRSALVSNMITAKQHYEVRPMQGKQTVLQYIWNDADMKALNAKSLASSSMKWSWSLFAFGSALSSLMMFLEYKRGKSEDIKSDRPPPVTLPTRAPNA